MIFVVLLICTVIGWLCGSALIGLGAGLVVSGLALWVQSDPYPLPRRRKKPRR